MKKSFIAITIGVLLVSCVLGCQNTGNKVGMDQKEIQGFKAKTFFDSNENIEVTIASDGKSTIVAVPKTAISRQNGMGDDEYTCLAKCAKISDLEQRLNCILACPVTKNYQVFIFSAAESKARLGRVDELNLKLAASLGEMSSAQSRSEVSRQPRF